MSEQPGGSSMVCTPWATIEDLPVPVVTEVDDDELLADALMTASELLYVLSGRRWRGGGCERTVHVQAPGRCLDVQALKAHRLDRVTARASVLRLPDYPVTAVTSVTAPDGDVVPSAGYRLVDGRYLQRLTADATPGRWALGEHEVEYTHGAAPPAGGKRAAAQLAAQLGLAWAGSAACRLPKRVQSITRQGVTVALLDPAEFLDKGRTGLVEVDTWLAAVNPTGARGRPTVWSPDTTTTTTHRG